MNEKKSLKRAGAPGGLGRVGRLTATASSSILLLVGASGCRDASGPPPPPEQAPAVTQHPRASVAGGLADRYIVVFKPGVADPPGLAERLTRENGGSLHYTYRFAIKGFAATLPAPAVAALRSNANVAYVQADAEIVGDGTDQPNAPVGLDRIDQHPLPLDQTYHYVHTGAGVSVYVVDSGIYYEHQEFGGRAHFGTDVFTDTAYRAGSDCYGHGTGVASVVGGATFGVAKQVQLYSVRVLDCTNAGTISGAVAGVDWVTGNAHLPAVANLSLSVRSGDGAALEDAIRASIASGIAYSLSAGNTNIDACTISPGDVSEGITTGGTLSTDFRASFSGYGPCVDWFAPAVNIPIASLAGPTASGLGSGTSYAVPHSTGVVALYLETNPAASPAQVLAALTAADTKGVVTNDPTGPRDLLYSLGDWTAPVATISSPASGSVVAPGTSVTFQGSGSDAEDGALPGSALVWTSSIDGQLGTGTSFSTSALSAGTHTITLTATDTGARTGTAVVQVIVNVAPTAGISAPASGSTVNQGTSVTFQGSGSDAEDGALPGSALVWTSSIDGQLGTGTSFSTSALSAGTHTITLTVTDSRGATGAAGITLNVNAGPVAAFTYTCAGATCSFTDRSTDRENGIVRWSWAFGKDGTSTAQNPTKTFTSPGTYPTKLTVTDTGGLSSTENHPVQCKSQKGVLTCS